MPAISIILPTYNRAHCIADMLDSIRKQTFTDYELIIVDDGSTDDTFRAIEPYLAFNVHYCKLDKNTGVAAARNYGMELVTGDYVSFVDSDDTLQPDYYGWFHHALSVSGFPQILYKRHRDPRPFRIYRQNTGIRFKPIAVYQYMYRRDFLTDKRIRFLENCFYGEDAYFGLCALFEAERYAETDFPSCYLYNTTGTDHLSDRGSRYTDWFRMMLLLKAELQRRHIDCERVFRNARGDIAYMMSGMLGLPQSSVAVEKRTDEFMKKLLG